MYPRPSILSLSSAASPPPSSSCQGSSGRVGRWIRRFTGLAQVLGAVNENGALGIIMHGGKRTGAGRKPAKIDLGELEKLCGLHCTDEELAAFFRVQVRTIERRRQKEPAFAAAMSRGWAMGRISLRRQLHLQAHQGKMPALIFLSKNMLGNHESVPPPAAQKAPKFEGTMTELLQLYWQLTKEAPDVDGRSCSPDATELRLRTS